MARDLLRQPKIYSAPKEQKEFVLPKFVKILIWISILIIGFIYLIYFSPVFKIKNIQIVGDPQKETIDYLKTLKNQNIFHPITEHQKENILRQHHAQLNIKISKGIPNTLRVIFDARTEKIIWLSGKDSYLVDANGIAFQKEQNSSNLIKVLDKKEIKVIIPSQVATQNFINFIISSQEKINSYKEFKVDHFEINETTFQVDAITNKNIKIIFDTTRSLSDQIDAFQKVYDEKSAEITEYVDLRVEGVVYYK